MKLIEILAQELIAWPSIQCKAIAQDCNGIVYFWNNENINYRNDGWVSPCGEGLLDLNYSMDVTCDAEDLSTAIVTRAEWQAAVDALNKPAVPEWDGEGRPPCRR